LGQSLTRNYCARDVSTLAAAPIGGQQSQIDVASEMPERIAINDNRTPVGTLSIGVMNVRLDARLGT
jgi:hypothetical protein